MFFINLIFLITSSVIGLSLLLIDVQKLNAKPVTILLLFLSCGFFVNMYQELKDK